MALIMRKFDNLTEIIDYCDLNAVKWSLWLDRNIHYTAGHIQTFSLEINSDNKLAIWMILQWPNTFELI